MSSENPRKQHVKLKALTSFGIAFPNRAGRSSRAERSLGFDNMLPTSREEEDEQISMANRLSLTDDPPLEAEILLYIQDRCTK